MSSFNRQVCSLSVFFLFLGCGALGCQRSTNSAKTLLPCFVVAPGATRIRQSKFLGRDQLSYRVDAPYPADHVLRLIREELQKNGWKPLAEDFLNPGLPSSHVRGWVYYEDPTTQPKTSARAWQGDWQNSAEDLLVYILEYRCKENLCASTLDLRDLEVIAIYVPADLANQMKPATSRKVTNR